MENSSVRMFLRTLHEEIKLLQPVVVVTAATRQLWLSSDWTPVFQELLPFLTSP